MTKRRITRKAGWVNIKKIARGPNGNPLCRWCNKETSSKRKTFCSDACVHEHKLRSDPSYVRHNVFERDKGICAICHTDTKTLEFATKTVVNRAKHCLRTKCAKTDIAFETIEALVLLCLGAPLGSRRAEGFWDCDHIVPVCEGGGECALDNYRTLCIICHKQVTAELQKVHKQTKKRR
jgi:5-methylcytosine-specific restriction protein A